MSEVGEGIDGWLGKAGACSSYKCEEAKRGAFSYSDRIVHARALRTTNDRWNTMDVDVTPAPVVGLLRLALGRYGVEVRVASRSPVGVTSKSGSQDHRAGPCRCQVGCSGAYTV